MNFTNFHLTWSLREIASPKDWSWKNTRLDSYYSMYDRHKLVGGFNPFEKY